MEANKEYDLGNMSGQEVFEVVAEHLLMQNQACKDSNNRCLYRHNGLKCAAGIFIKDEDYVSDMEGLTWGSLTCYYGYSKKHNTLINTLQSIHDNESVTDWYHELELIAQDNNLNTIKLEEFAS